MRHRPLLVIGVLFLLCSIGCDRASNTSQEALSETSSNTSTSRPVASAGHSAEPAATDSQVEQILRETQAVYAAAKTYRDTGVETTYLTKPPAGPKVTAERHFETRILAPTTFRVDIREGTAKGADVYWTGGEPEGKGQRFSATTQTSFDAPAEYLLPGNYEFTTIVPRMMMPFLLIGFSKPVTQMKNASLAGEETIDGHRCWVVTGENSGSEKTLWIDQQSHLIRQARRRALEKHRGDASAPSSETIITYKPELDPSLTDEDLRFVASTEKQ